MKLSSKKITVLKRLTEIGVEIEKKEGYYNLVIPHGFSEPRCVEFGFLIAQLCDFEFPNGFTSLCDLPSSVYKKIKKEGHVSFVDSYPHGMKYRVNLIQRKGK